MVISKKLFLLLSSAMFFAGCSASINPMYGKHKDDPKDFIERRKPVDNDFVAKGGRKKKSNSSILMPGQPGNASGAGMMVGSTGYSESSRSGDGDQTTYTYSKLKENNPKGNQGFSKDRLNISHDHKDKNTTSFFNTFIQDGEYIACVDPELSKEIESAKVSEDELEESKKKETFLS